ncbi:helicase HerA-like domain-containing protein [Sulfuricurvum sp.]|uniref:helicase HerA-like domain-containing protein n=1 Tax=Sulfuricurvum sp. TaxID=2025608 RepID=UPI003BB0BED7
MSHPQAIAKSSDTFLTLLPSMANRHGLITGATGTGKTITLQKLIESFSSIGVPCVVSDIKGDLSGIASIGGNNPKVSERLSLMGLEADYTQFPVTFWDVWGENGHPVRTTISDMGPLLLSRLLGLNETQSGVLNLTFKVADDEGLALLDLKDLRSMIQNIGERAKELSLNYGNVSSASIGAIQRALLSLESQGADMLFGEPMLNIHDLIQTVEGKGVINLLDATKLINTPKLYASLLLWMLSELFEALPEAGDTKAPKLLFFFDEAHLLFNDAPDILVEKIEQVVRLIRSKGVGIYFITQHPNDIPEKVAAQLGNRIAHALRAFTPKDQQALRAAADTMRDNETLDERTALMELGVGEALISFLDEKGIPGITRRALIIPPFSHIGPISTELRQELMKTSIVGDAYNQRVDSESAYEYLTQRREEDAVQKAEDERLKAERKVERETPRGRESPAEALAKSAARAIGSQLGRAIIRGILGSIFKK